MVDGTKQLSGFNALQRRFSRRNSSFFPSFVVSLRLLYGILKKTSFSPVIHRARVHRTDLSLVWGSLRLAPIIKAVIFNQASRMLNGIESFVVQLWGNKILYLMEASNLI